MSSRQQDFGGTFDGAIHYTESNCKCQVLQGVIFINVALYARVSTTEQRDFGLSIDAQLADLREYCQANGHIIVGEYVDGGISGKKPPNKRPAMSRFFSDLDNGLSIDVLLFTKLDRFFRSVKLYYQAVDVLDRHKVAWQAVQEDYETLTASGRMKVNIMLSVAENEADRTGERVRAVFNRKIQQGEWLSPQGLCIGYSIKDKRLAPNSDAPAVKAAFEYYLDNHSVLATADYLREEYGIDRMTTPLRRVLKNRLYTGEYRGNSDFCEPIVPKELFDAVQAEIKRRSVRHNQTGRVYLFAGLLRCAVCGHTLGGMTTRKGGNEYQNYRCTNAMLNHRCHNTTHISERKIEEELLQRLAPELDALIAQAKVRYKQKPQKKKQPANIQPKLDRLKDLYVDGLIDKAQYLADREKLLQTLSQADNEPQKPDYAALRQLIGQDFRSRYSALNPQEQRTVWGVLIDHIDIDESRNMRLFFKA